MRKLVTELRCSDRSNAHEFSCSCWYLIWSGHDFTCWWNLRLLLQQQQQQQKTSSHIYYSLLHIASNPWEHFFDQAAEAATAAVIIGIYFGCLFLYCCCWFFFCASFRKFGCIQIHSSSFFRTPRQTHNHTHTVIRSTRGAMQSIILERTYWIRLLMWIIWVARCERKIGAHVWYDVYNPVYCMRMPTTRFDEMNRCDTLQSFRNVYTLHSLHAVHGGHVTSESRTVSITPSHDGNENTIAWYMNYFIRSSITCFDFEYY